MQAGRLIEVKIDIKHHLGPLFGWPRPLNRGGRLIEFIVFVFIQKFQDFELDMWPFNRGPLTVIPIEMFLKY
jgi:hypothetical protein